MVVSNWMTCHQQNRVACSEYCVVCGCHVLGAWKDEGLVNSQELDAFRMLLIACKFHACPPQRSQSNTYSPGNKGLSSWSILLCLRYGTQRDLLPKLCLVYAGYSPVSVKAWTDFHLSYLDIPIYCQIIHGTRPQCHQYRLARNRTHDFIVSFLERSCMNHAPISVAWVMKMCFKYNYCG